MGGALSPTTGIGFPKTKWKEEPIKINSKSNLFIILIYQCPLLLGVDVNKILNLFDVFKDNREKYSPPIFSSFKNLKPFFSSS